ncbi:MAG: MATE family efflux transporter [Lachnospiraceae bacterium]|nr:MATE family efflux transporter [Lachnospiraceae bacterium]
MKKIDMTKGPIVAPLFLFILPLIGSSIFQQLYNTVDFLFVGNLLDVTAAAAVGASSTLITCCIGLFSGVSVGTSVIMSQAIGGQDLKKAKEGLHASVLFGLIGGIIVMVIGILLAPPILQIMNTPETAMEQAVAYMRIYLLSLPMLVFYNMVSGAMRSYGDSDTPFRILVICGFVNVAADYFFMRVIPLGVAGVGIATAISQGLSAVLIYIAASNKNRLVPLTFNTFLAHGDVTLAEHLKIHWKVMKEILRIGIPAGAQSVLITFSNVIVQYYINDFGEVAVAAFATYYKVENFIYLPIMAFGQAATTFAGQNFGAGQISRIKKGTLITDLMGAAVVAAIAGVILLFPRTVFTWFMKDQDVVTNALIIATLTFPFYWIYPILEVTGGALRGMGYALSSMIIIISNLGALRIALLAIFSKTFHSLRALAAVYPISWAGAAICFVVQFFIVMRMKSMEKAETS